MNVYILFYHDMWQHESCSDECCSMVKETIIGVFKKKEDAEWMKNLSVDACLSMMSFPKEPDAYKDTRKQQLDLYEIREIPVL